MKSKVVVIGAGGHAKVVLDILEKQNCYEIAGLLDAHKPAGTEVYGYRVLGEETALAGDALRDIAYAIVAIGDNWVRSLVAKKLTLLRPDLRFATAIHPAAVLAKGTVIGAGTAVMAGVVVNSDTVVGQHCLLNTGASLDHDNAFGDFASIAPGAVTGGGVQVGEYTAISLGAKISHNRSLGSHSVIGAGALVLQDVGSRSLCWGTPAKVIRQREIGEKYL